DHVVEAYRAATLLAATTLPLAALRLVPSPYREPFGGAALLILLGAAVGHRALASRREEGAASRTIGFVRLFVEVLGLVLLGVCAAGVATEEAVPLWLAFWALFLLRLSVSDLMYPAVLAEATGFKQHVARELRAATRRRKRRAERFLKALAKGLLLALWLVVP